MLLPEATIAVRWEEAPGDIEQTGWGVVSAQDPKERRHGDNWAQVGVSTGAKAAGGREPYVLQAHPGGGSGQAEGSQGRAVGGEVREAMGDRSWGAGDHGRTLAVTLRERSQGRP